MNISLHVALPIYRKGLPTSRDREGAEAFNRDHSRDRSGHLRLFAQCGDPVLQRPQADPQHLGGHLAIAVHVLEGEFDVSLLEFDQWLARLEHCTAPIAM